MYGEYQRPCVAQGIFMDQIKDELKQLMLQSMDMCSVQESTDNDPNNYFSNSTNPKE